MELTCLLRDRKDAALTSRRRGKAREIQLPREANSLEIFDINNTEFQER